MKITVDNQEFEESLEIYPVSEGIYYKHKWYTPIYLFKKGDWVIFYSETLNKFIIDKIKEITPRSYYILEGGLEPFKKNMQISYNNSNNKSFI